MGKGGFLDSLIHIMALSLEILIQCSLEHFKELSLQNSLLVVWAIALHGMYKSGSHESREYSTSDARFPLHV
jgi:hypothetical protein